MTRKDVKIMYKVRGKNLNTPICKIRVFHIQDPTYTFAFVRQEGNEAVVVDDNNEAFSEGKLTKFPAKDLVNVVVFRQALLDSKTKTVSGKKK